MATKVQRDFGNSQGPNLWWRNKAYVDKGDWRCESSPTLAHHWILNTQGKGKCKHCGAER